ncbi:hypothetical protein M3Y97_00142200 [Aphelenchoides bicaudatus]|nr:hypothetical protein M3Y97_00142200 [Aphelenchoides bicaudatus]
MDESQLEDWTSTPFRKLLFDEWRSRIGICVVENDILTAQTMCGVSSIVLQFAEQLLKQFNTDSINRKQLEQAISYAFNNYQNDEFMGDYRQSSDPAPRAGSSRLSANPDVQSRHDVGHSDDYSSYDKRGSPSGSNFASRTWKKTTPPTRTTSANMYRRSSQMHHVLLICGKWPKIQEELNTVTLIRYLYESPLAIETSLSGDKSLTVDTKFVSIASNTHWAGKKSKTFSEELESLCVFIGKRCPNVKIKLLGFYSKNGTTHLDDYNYYLKDIQDRNRDWIEYVSFEKLLSSKELSGAAANASRPTSLNEYTIVKTLKRFADYEDE